MTAGPGLVEIFTERDVSDVMGLISASSPSGLCLTGRRRWVVAIYGVRGVGSIYYMAYAGSHIELVNEAQLWAIVAFTILLSTILHGFTAGLAVEKATGQTQTEKVEEG